MIRNLHKEEAERLVANLESFILYSEQSANFQCGHSQEMERAELFWKLICGQLESLTTEKSNTLPPRMHRHMTAVLEFDEDVRFFLSGSNGATERYNSVYMSLKQRCLMLTDALNDYLETCPAIPQSTVEPPMLPVYAPPELMGQRRNSTSPKRAYPNNFIWDDMWSGGSEKNTNTVYAPPDFFGTGDED